MAHDSVSDLEDPGDLLERLRLGREGQQVVGAVGLVVDLVGELSAAPDVVGVDSAAAPLRAPGRASAKFRRASLARFLLPSVLGGLAVSRTLRVAPAGQGRKRAAV